MNNTFILLSLFAAVLSPTQVKILVVIGVLFVAANMFFLRWALKQLRVEPDSESDAAANSGVSNAIGENPIRSTVGVPRNRSLRPRDPLAEAAKSTSPERVEPELAGLSYAGATAVPRPSDEITPRPAKLASFEPLIPFSPGATHSPAAENPLPATSRSIAAEPALSLAELATAAPPAAPATAPAGALTLSPLPGEKPGKDEPKLSLPVVAAKSGDAAPAPIPGPTIAVDKSAPPVDAKLEPPSPVVTPAAVPAAIEPSKPVGLAGATPIAITSAPSNSPSETESKAVQLAAAPAVQPTDSDPDDVKKTKSPKTSAAAAPPPEVSESAVTQPGEKSSPQMSGLILPPLVATQTPEPEKKSQSAPIPAAIRTAPESAVVLPPAEAAPATPPAPVAKPAKGGRSRVFLPANLEPAPSTPTEISLASTVSPVSPTTPATSATLAPEPVAEVATAKEPVLLSADPVVSAAPLTVVAATPEVTLPASKVHPVTPSAEPVAATPVVAAPAPVPAVTPFVETKPAAAEALTGYEPISAPIISSPVQPEEPAREISQKTVGEPVTPEPVTALSSSAVPAIAESPVTRSKEPEPAPTPIASQPELAASGAVLEEDTGHLTAKATEAEASTAHFVEAPAPVAEPAPSGAFSLIPAGAPSEEAAFTQEAPEPVEVVEKPNPNPGLTPVDAMHIHGAAVEIESAPEELPSEPSVEPTAPHADVPVESVQQPHQDESQPIVEDVVLPSETPHATPADLHDLPITALEPVPAPVVHEEAHAPVDIAPSVLQVPEPVAESAPLAVDSHPTPQQAAILAPAVEPSPITPTSSQAAEAPAEVAPISTPRSNMTTTESTSPQPASGRASAQLTLGFEVTSLQLTPFFKLGAVQLRPLSNIVSLHLITTGQAENPLAAGISFQIDTVDLDENAHVRSILLKPLPQAQAAATPQPKLQVDNVQLGQGAEGPIQVTSSQGTSTAVQLLATCTIAAMDFTPAFEIGSLRLEPTSNVVLLRTAPSQRPAALDLPPSFEVANVQLEGNAQISSVRLTPSVAK